ncbi:MAG TPA: hypothetical protein VFK86_09045 [Bauldia sp.]|nr:hypothetical protein [Bauldia sp.]
MKTLRKKRPDAAQPRSDRPKQERNVSGAWQAGLWNDHHAALLGKIAAAMPQVEELATDLAAQLLGEPALPGRTIFRGLAGEATRLKVLRALLDGAGAGGRRRAIDAAVSDYAAARRKWRSLLHGLWYTHENGRTFLAAPSGDEAASFLVAREVKTTELEAELARLTALTEALLGLAHPGARIRTPARDGRGAARRQSEKGRAKRTAPKREAGKRRRRVPPKRAET